ncbi:family 43 glycosylhydrolase [Daejeonella lutea]|uniref:Beta-xylosidase n=1 Tax=Daejeonella lutea TaxID=572036 RepID=A0A1T5BER8_9SPHI|nr:family 43 glycosylhydrolase [Daejeonella lutea]SKB45510.1 Beta-xylosidase [Daejeonella lutea]
MIKSSHFTKVILAITVAFIFPFSLSAQKNDAAIIPGDFADPSVIKVGKTYFAVGTSSEWAPHFPIFKSRDLKNWKQSGYVFDKTPEWSSSSFWAPEYYKIKDTYYIYYTARRKSDNTSYIGVATSKYPDKGFIDHGLLVTYGKEAIDAFIYKDEGQLYITFKAYGLDKRPIEILASKLSSDGLRLEGEPFTLLKDEKGLGMEGQSILKHGDYYYIFYSGGNCCGVKCSYNATVVRSKAFTGPYEAHPNNPILSENDNWKCMGHGTFVKSPDNNDVYLHHAYNKQSTVFTGRQGLLSELNWGKDWPTFNAQQSAGNPITEVNSSFDSKKPDTYWQWDFRNSSPVVKQQNGRLYLSGSLKQGNESGIVLTIRPVSDNFTMTTTISNNNTALKGLSYYGDANASLGIGVENNRVIVWLVKGNKFAELVSQTIVAESPVQLRLQLGPDRICKFFYKQINSDWKELRAHNPVTAAALPQWDRSPRAGLHFKGLPDQDGQFDNFNITYQ